MNTILIVDDKENNLISLERVLRRLDVRIIWALSGEEALRACLNHDFALIILDVQMPSMDGYELAGFLRSDPATQDIPIIFLTAVCSSEQYVFQGYASGGVDYITKPFNPDILLSKVKIFLELHKKKNELTSQKAQLESLVHHLKEQIDAREKAEQRLRLANENLEITVFERTADLSRTVKALEDANKQLMIRSTQLRALAGELTMAEHRERERISRVLHDGLQQHLAIVKLQLGLLTDQFDRDELRHATSGIETLVSESIQMSRSLSAELSPPVLYKNGLCAGLEWLACWMMDKHGLHVDLAVEESPELPKDVSVLVFESVRELLFNTVKHSKVSSACVSLKRVDDAGIQISVSDEGQGFDTDRIKPVGESGTGFGLFSIHERIALIGGTLHTTSSPGRGSCFSLTIPNDIAKTQEMHRGQDAFQV